MELPRIASQTSVCPPSIQLLTEYPKPRTPVSKRLLSASLQQQQQQQQQQQPPQQQSAEPQFAILPHVPTYRPSRRREEARVLENLRKRLQAVRISHANRPEPIEATCVNNNQLSPTDLDNRPLLLQKILSNRPVSMVLDVSDLTTAWKDSDFITDCLCWHNVYRQRHGSPPLTMCSELCYLAQTWANHLAHTNRFYYRPDKDIGQNLFCRSSNVLVNDVTGQEVAAYWYSAVRQYDFRKEYDVLHTNVNAGHFTQLVWAASRHFGIGKARSRSGKIVVVAHYAPAGNVSGAYLENVLPPTAEYFTQSMQPSASLRLPSLPSPPNSASLHTTMPTHRFLVASESSTSESGQSISGST